jgi:hypothetical protein
MRKVLAAIGLIALYLALVPAGAAGASASSPENRAGASTGTPIALRGSVSQPPLGIFSDCMSGGACKASTATASTWTGVLSGPTSITIDGTRDPSTMEATGTISETLGPTVNQATVPGVYVADSTKDPCAAGNPPCTGTVTLQGTFHFWGNINSGEVTETIASGTDVFGNSSGEVTYDFTIQPDASLAGGYQGNWNCADSACAHASGATLEPQTISLSAPAGAIAVHGGFIESTEALAPSLTTSSCPIPPDLPFFLPGGSLWQGSLTGHTVFGIQGCAYSDDVSISSITESLQVGVPPNLEPVYQADDPGGTCGTAGSCPGKLHVEGFSVGSSDNSAAEVDETLRCDVAAPQITPPTGAPVPLMPCDGIWKDATGYATGELLFAGVEPAGTEAETWGYRGYVCFPHACQAPGSGGHASGAKSTGGGWLADTSGNKLNFGFNAQQSSNGPQGNLELNDSGAGVKIHFDTVTTIGAVQTPCGAVPQATNALEFDGTGTYNGTAGASFRVCVQDNAEPGQGHDLFYLACTNPIVCSYNTEARSPGDLLAGGNIQVRGGSSSTSSTSATAAPATIVLDPLLQTSGVAGQAQMFTASVYDQNQQLLPNASVLLTATGAGGTMQTLSAITNASGVASIATVDFGQTAEYIASAGEVQSNAIRLSVGL